MSPEAVVLSIKLLFALMAVVVVAVFVVRPVLRMVRSKPDVDLLLPDYLQMAEDAEELEIPAEPDSRMPERTEIIRSARDDPQHTAMMVQRWLKERK